VHTLSVLLEVLLILLVSALALGALRSLGGWPGRRDLQVLILAMPLVALGFSLVTLHHFIEQACFLTAPRWDAMLGVALPIAMALVATGGLALSALRLVLMNWLIVRGATLPGPELRAAADALAQRLGVPSPRLRLSTYESPVALSCGLFRPTILLSRWIVDRLDARELESVLAHELAHIARGDYTVIWLATLLRDAFFYLPTSRSTHRLLQEEKELACDDLAVHVTRRPLALASALGKVWSKSMRTSTLTPAQSLVDVGLCMERRLGRLLESHELQTPTPASRSLALVIGTGTLVALLLLEMIRLAIIFKDLGCDPMSALGNWF
jgi:beta-lactamase regulating signal transducer with metallopeptidase domain